MIFFKKSVLKNQQKVGQALSIEKVYQPMRIRKIISFFSQIGQRRPATNTNTNETRRKCYVINQ